MIEDFVDFNFKEESKFISFVLLYCMLDHKELAAKNITSR